MGQVSIVADNRKALHLYSIEDRFEAGMVLMGSEVKALREGRASLRDAYAVFHGLELYLLNMHIAPYSHASLLDYNPVRSRKLLLHRSELQKLWGSLQVRGYSLVPLKVYFKNGKAKVELGLGTGKKLHDKRQTEKEREAKRYMDRVQKKYQR